MLPVRKEGPEEEVLEKREVHLTGLPETRHWYVQRITIFSLEQDVLTSTIKTEHAVMNTIVQNASPVLVAKLLTRLGFARLLPL